MQSADPTPAAEARRGERTLALDRLLIALGAVALIVSLFLDWYGDDDSALALSAWGSFELVDLLLAALALAALYAVIEGIARPARAPLMSDAVLRLAGPVALVLVVIPIIDEPPLFAAIDPGLEVGVWIALAGCLLMTIGALLASVRISVVLGARDRGAGDPGAETRTMRTEPGPTSATPAEPPPPPRP